MKAPREILKETMREIRQEMNRAYGRGDLKAAMQFYEQYHNLLAVYAAKDKEKRRQE